MDRMDDEVELVDGIGACERDTGVRNGVKGMYVEVVEMSSCKCSPQSFWVVDARRKRNVSGFGNLSVRLFKETSRRWFPFYNAVRFSQGCH